MTFKKFKVNNVSCERLNSTCASSSTITRMTGQSGCHLLNSPTIARYRHPPVTPPSWLCMVTTLTWEQTSGGRPERNESAIQFATRMKSIREEAETSLKMAAQKMKEQYDCSKRDAPEFKVGDSVLLNVKNLRTTQQMKLENLHNGPFKVLKKIRASAYTLDIPDAWKRVSIHPTFNVKLLIPYHRPQFPSQQAPPPPPPDVINDHEIGRAHV